MIISAILQKAIVHEFQIEIEIDYYFIHDEIVINATIEVKQRMSRMLGGLVVNTRAKVYLRVAKLHSETRSITSRILYAKSYAM